ncbi:hypothetical protein QNL37_29215, partial [Pseudomonas paracarnis]|nr:hypothetical protein [Pseudomonas paracarnis]
LFNGLYNETLGVGLARDANASVLQKHRGDAIAGKPAPTFDRVSLGFLGVGHIGIRGRIRA